MIVLNLGCGYRQLKNTIGLDRLKKSSADIICDLYYLPIRSNAADLLILEEVLEHLFEPVRALEEFKRVGKKILLTVPNVYYLPRILNYLMMKVGTVTHDHIHAFTIENMKNILELTGYKILFYDYIKGHSHKRNLPTRFFTHSLRVLAKCE